VAFARGTQLVELGLSRHAGRSCLMWSPWKIDFCCTVDRQSIVPYWWAILGCGSDLGPRSTVFLTMVGIPVTVRIPIFWTDSMRFQCEGPIIYISTDWSKFLLWWIITTPLLVRCRLIGVFFICHNVEMYLYTLYFFQCVLLITCVLITCHTRYFVGL